MIMKPILPELVVATGNAHKVQELGKLFDGFRLVTMRDAGFDGDIEENGSTFAENAMIKARTVYDTLHRPCIADDSGLCVDALDGAPGIYSARFAGEGAGSIERNAKLLKMMLDVPDGMRTARFMCVMACILDDDTAFTVTGCCEGTILRSPRGENGFGYDPIFYVQDRGCSMAELEPDVKNRISHRARAAEGLRKKILDILGGSENA